MEEHEFKKPLIPIYTPMHYRYEDWQYPSRYNILWHLGEYNTLSSVTLGDTWQVYRHQGFN